jgi:ABC-type Fe3+/spermidine/putrescine transport system ATPase subunit
MDTDSAAVIDVNFAGKAGRFHLDVSFASARERVVLFGPSGSGKTLTLRAIAGIFRPHEARILMRGVTFDDSATRIHLRSSQRNVGYVPQGYALFPHLTVRQNILYGVPGRGQAASEHRVRGIIEMLGLAGLEDTRPLTLSGGQQQRVALARALATEPLALLLDEPLAAIDTPLRAGLRAELANIQAATGKVMITVTHDLGDAFALGDWIVVMDGGRVLQQGSKEEVYNHPATTKVAALVGIRNVVPARVVDVSDEWVVVNWDGVQLTAMSRGERFRPGEPVHLLMRSTQLMIRRPEDDKFGERLNVMSGEIVTETVSAEARKLFVRTAGSVAPYDLEVDLPEYTYFRLRLDAGKTVEISIRPERIHVLRAEGDGAGHLERNVDSPQATKRG